MYVYISLSLTIYFSLVIQGHQYKSLCKIQSCTRNPCALKGQESYLSLHIKVPKGSTYPLHMSMLHYQVLLDPTRSSLPIPTHSNANINLSKALFNKFINHCQSNALHMLVWFSKRDSYEHTMSHTYSNFNFFPGILHPIFPIFQIVTTIHLDICIFWY